jgi:carboxymethylenebutenolidase
MSVMQVTVAAPDDGRGSDPCQAEPMSDIRTETVPLVDGSELRLTVAEPDASVRGGIVVLHDARGITDAVRDLVQGFAGDGWIAVAPHLYHRDAADEVAADQAQEQADRLDRDQIIADTDTAFGWLAERDVKSDRMGVVGFDLGGAVALAVAATRTLGAAVTVGDEVSSANLVELVSAENGLTCPWLGIFGTDDPGIDRLRVAASSSEVATDVVVYPGDGGHRFDDDPDTAAEARQRTLNWFDSHLR